MHVKIGTEVSYFLYGHRDHTGHNARLVVHLIIMITASSGEPIESTGHAHAEIAHDHALPAWHSGDFLAVALCTSLDWRHLRDIGQSVPDTE
jgi:hypothetical protein